MQAALVPINALITGFVQNNREDEAIELFQQVLKDGFKPSNFTFASILSGCTRPVSQFSNWQTSPIVTHRNLLF
jgi:pentatricopeptide repeat protein